MNRNFSDNIAVRGSVGGWFGALINIPILILTVSVVQLAIRNLANTQRNAENTTEMIAQLKKINEQLERKL